MGGGIEKKEHGGASRRESRGMAEGMGHLCREWRRTTDRWGRVCSHANLTEADLR